jgi:hypothetical protein
MCCSFTYLCYISECYIDVPVRQARLCLRKKTNKSQVVFWRIWFQTRKFFLRFLKLMAAKLHDMDSVEEITATINQQNQQNQYLGQMFFRCFEANDTKSTETPVPGVARSLLCLRSRQEFGSDRFGMVGCSTWTTHKINLGLFNLQAWQCHSISVFN